MYTIRPFEFTDAEYEAVVAVSNAAWPDIRNAVAHWKHNDKERNPNYLYQRFVMEHDGQIVAVGDCFESSWSYVPGKYNFGLSMHPDHASIGVEEQFYQQVLTFLAERDPKPTVLKTDMREDKPDRIKFLTDRGFQETMRDNVSELDVTDFDFTRFEGIPEKVSQSGIEILTLPEVQQRDPEWLQKMYDLENAIDADVPSVDQSTPQPLEEYAKMFKHPNFCPEANFLALDNGQFVGLSSLWVNSARPNKLGVGITGVLRSHRRRSIATALKLCTIEFTQKHGAQYIETENEENNPMYALNAKLGFKPKPGWVEFRKELKEIR